MEKVVGSEDVSWRVVVPEVIGKLDVSLEIVGVFFSSSSLRGGSGYSLGCCHLLSADARCQPYWLVVHLGG